MTASTLAASVAAEVPATGEENDALLVAGGRERGSRRLGRSRVTGPRRDPGAVYRALAPAVLGYFRAERAPDPEDLCGDVFLQVVRDLPRFSGDDDALRRWVFTIAHHRLVDARRRIARRPRTAGESVPEAPASVPAEAIDPELVAALDGLTADQREVVVLRFVADLPTDAVANLTGRSPAAVKALQHRGLEALAGRLRSS